MNKTLFHLLESDSRWTSKEDMIAELQPKLGWSRKKLVWAVKTLEDEGFIQFRDGVFFLSVRTISDDDMGKA